MGHASLKKKSPLADLSKRYHLAAWDSLDTYLQAIGCSKAGLLLWLEHGLDLASFVQTADLQHEITPSITSDEHALVIVAMCFSFRNAILRAS